MAFFVRFLIYYFGDMRGYSGGDERNYWHQAHRFLQGGERVGQYLPTWAMLLSWPLRLWNDIDFLRCIVLSIGAINAALVYLIAAGQFGEKTAVISGVLFCFFPEHVFTSHYLYAEIPLEFIILSITWLAFRHKISGHETHHVYFLCLLFGLGTLFKHFVVVAFAAYILALLIHRLLPLAKLPVATAAFLAFPVLYSVNLYAKGSDPFFIFNSPIKSMREWDINEISRGPEYSNKSDKALSYLRKKLAKPPRYFWTRLSRNFNALWSPHSYPARKIRRGGYSPRIPPEPTIYFSKFYYAVIVYLGLVGFLLHSRSVFKTYGFWSLVLLTAMSAFFLMASRYRLPFMFPMVIMAGYALSRNKTWREPLHNLRRRDWITFGSAIILFTWTLF